MNTNVNTKDDFLVVLAAIIEGLKNNRSGWGNKTLPDYLEAMQSWIEDMDGFYANNNVAMPQTISWGVFADILMAAKVYE